MDSPSDWSAAKAVQIEFTSALIECTCSPTHMHVCMAVCSSAFSWPVVAAWQRLTWLISLMHPPLQRS